MKLKQGNRSQNILDIKWDCLVLSWHWQCWLNFHSCVHSSVFEVIYEYKLLSSSSKKIQGDL